MDSEVRRIIAVEAHRLRTGTCPIRIHSLGTGESFDIQPTGDGFFDVASGLTVKAMPGSLVVANGRGRIDLRLIGDVGFDGFAHESRKAFSGRAGGGASVTLYDDEQNDFFQYAIATEYDGS
jgi:hypothetical protein